MAKDTEKNMAQDGTTKDGTTKDGAIAQDGAAAQAEGGSPLARVLRYIVRYYAPHLMIVVACIIFAAWASVQGSLFQETLIDDYLVPLVRQASPDYAPLAAELLKLAVVLGLGAVASWAYNRIMVTVSQGTMKRLREELFTHMETLPIKYFDTHAHGDIMSVYTNDVDTLRQVVSQSMPQLLNSLITVVMTFASMLMVSWQLTLVSLAMVGVTLAVSSKLGKRSST